MMNRNNNCGHDTDIRDYGANPMVVNIHRMTEQNRNFRTALWTGTHLQVTLMSIEPGGEIGIECHDNLDQFIRIESGTAMVKMGERRDDMRYVRQADDNYAMVIPCGTWHNVINTGCCPLKLYSIYAPPQHPFGTVQSTKEIADVAENH